MLKKEMNQEQHFLRDRKADALRLKETREQSWDRMPALIGKSRSVFRKSKSAKNLIDRAEFRPRPRIFPMDLRQCEFVAGSRKTRNGTMARDSEVGADK